ncbi:hypothetical protein GCM10023340_38750 [Nocardioides marinquilinus]|uniref:Uncharacterized protein n=1 Tax=Nocardioides marinquilinus TaxID=1210400 RepID=A0ABP9PZD6_9ACTN
MSGRPTRVVGIDPGPTPGVVRLTFDQAAGGRLVEHDVVQCSAGVLPVLLPALLEDLGPDDVVAVERFVTRGRLNTAQQITAAQVVQVEQLCQLSGYLPRGGVVHLRSAGQVKPWATDARLDRLGGKHGGLLKALAGMQHARDAARHALFAAVRDAGIPDPMSKEFRQ